MEGIKPSLCNQTCLAASASGTSMAVNDTEETAHLGKEKRLLNRLLYEACKKKILEKIEQGNMHEKDKRLKELQGLTVLCSAKISLGHATRSVL